MSYSEFQAMFGIQIKDLPLTDLNYFYKILSLVLVEDLALKQNEKKEILTEDDQNSALSSYFPIFESYFKRIYPGVYYKNPFTFSLVTANGKLPLGIKVIIFVLNSMIGS